MKKFILLACLIYCLNGFGHIIIGTVLEPMVQSYGIHYSDGGQLIMNQFLGFLVGVLFAPAIVKFIGRRKTIFISLITFATGQILFGLQLDWTINLIVAPFSGAGIGITETIIAAIIIAFLKEKKASTLILAEVFFGVGALIIPIVSSVLIALGVWQMSFIFVAVAVSIVIFLWTILSFDEMEEVLKKQQQVEKDEKKQKPSYKKKHMPIILVGATFFFMYVGAEMVLPNYLPTILSHTTDLGESSLALSITVFWLAMTIGRMMMTFIIDRIGYHRLFIISCVGQLFTLILFALSPSIVVSYIAIFLTGILMGGIFSIGLLIINETMVGMEEWTTSLLVALGGFGGAILPKIIGIFLDRYPIQIVLWTIVLFALSLVILMSAIYYFRKNMVEEKSLIE